LAVGRRPGGGYYPETNSFRKINKGTPTMVKNYLFLVLLFSSSGILNDHGPLPIIKK
jgi:hypothetical protein